MAVKLPTSPTPGKEVPPGWFLDFYNAVNRFMRNPVRGDGKTIRVGKDGTISAVPRQSVNKAGVFNEKSQITIGTSASNDYVCDGTADNVQWQSAIDEAAWRGVPIVVETDSYVFADEVVFPSGNFMIAPTSGGAYTITPASTGFSCFTSYPGINNNDKAINLSIQELTITNSGANVFDYGIRIFGSHNCNVSLMEVDVSGCAESGISISAQQVNMRSCVVSSNTKDGIYLSATNVNMLSCTANSNSSDGIVLTAAFAGLSNCTANSNTAYGIQLTGETNAIIGDCTATGNGGAASDIFGDNAIIIDCTAGTVVGRIVTTTSATSIVASYGVDNSYSTATITDDADAGTSFNGDPNGLSNMTFSATGRLTAFS